jgi:hypothetical protein
MPPQVLIKLIWFSVGIPYIVTRNSKAPEWIKGILWALFCAATGAQVALVIWPPCR